MYVWVTKLDRIGNERMMGAMKVGEGKSKKEG